MAGELCTITLRPRGLIRAVCSFEAVDPMSPKHIALAVFVTAIWGFNFVVIRLGLDSLPPFLLAALRFAVAGVPAFFIARPKLSWPRLFLIGMALFFGQFAFLFPAMTVGMPPGLASVVLQSQAFFTVLFAAGLLGERPRLMQLAGCAVAGAGLVTIATTTGLGFTVSGLLLALAAAASWAMGNVLVRTAGKVDMFPLIIWLCLIPPLPFLAMSFAFEGWPAIQGALSGLMVTGVASILYLAIPTTIVGFGIWGFLLKTYPASTVAPFSLLVPLFGTLSAYLVLGETFSPTRLVGMVLVVCGLAFIVWPARPRKVSPAHA